MRPPQVMNQKSVANHCGLEMGAIVTPLGTSPHPAPKLHRKPMRCNGCGAYMNKYCTVTPRTGAYAIPAPPPSAVHGSDPRGCSPCALLCA